MADAPSRPSCDFPPPVSAIPLLSAVSLDLSAPVLTSQHFLPYKPPVPPFSPCLPALPSTWFQFLSSAPPSSVIFPLAFLDLWFLLYCVSSCSSLFRVSFILVRLLPGGCCPQSLYCPASPRMSGSEQGRVSVSEEQDSVTLPPFQGYLFLATGFSACIWIWWDCCLFVRDSVIS